MYIDGIVLRVTPLQEKDAMVTILSSNKILSFFAKGVLSIKSKNSFALSLFSHSKFNVIEGEQNGLSLREAKIIKSYPNSISNFDSLAVLNYICELTLKCIEINDIDDLYNYLLNSLELIEKGFDAFTLLNIYIAQVSKIIGISLNVNQCIKCSSKTDIVGIDFNNGGFVCNKCFNPATSLKLNERFLKIFRYIFMVNYDQIERVEFTKEENNLVFNELNKHIFNQTGANIKSVDLINKI